MCHVYTSYIQNICSIYTANIYKHIYKGIYSIYGVYRKTYASLITPWLKAFAHLLWRLLPVTRWHCTAGILIIDHANVSKAKTLNTKASSSPFHIMLAPIIIWKKWEPRNPVPALFRAYWKLGKNTKTLDLRLKYSEKYSKFILSVLEFSSNVTITCTQCVAHLLE